MALSAELLGDRWTLLILREAFYGVVRYDDMLKDLVAPRSMLTDRLGKMVDRGLMKREPYHEPGNRTRHAYVLTDSGRALSLTLIALTQWGEQYVTGKNAPVEVVHMKSGRPLRVNLTDEHGKVVPVSEARLRLVPKNRGAKAARKN